MSNVKRKKMLAQRKRRKSATAKGAKTEPYADEENERITDAISHTDKKMVATIKSLVRSNRKRGEHFRKARKIFVEQYAGPYYRPANKAVTQNEPINLIQMAANVWSRQMVSGNPAASITPADPNKWPQADDLELDVNQLIEEMDLKVTLRHCALDSMFCCGIALVGTESNGKEVFVDGEWVETTDTFADWIDLDDWVQDLSVTRWKDSSFYGHKFRRPLKAAKADENYDKEAREKLSATNRKYIDNEGNELIQDVGTGEQAYGEESLFEEVELWHIYFPRHGRVMILPVEGDDVGLASYDWEGPSRGPYHRLGMMKVPGNVMPLAPVNAIADLHFFQNNLYRKVMDQAERAKTVGVIAGRAAADGKRILNAKDGEFVLSDRPEATREVKLGGVDGATLQMTVQVQRLFSYLGGNIDSVAGLSAQTETVGQDRLLAQASSKLIKEMQDRTTDFAAGIIEDIAWWEQQNPNRETTVAKRIPGTDITFPVKVRSFDYREDAKTFQYNVVPFTLANRTPEERMGVLLAFFNGFIMPYGAQLQAEGMGVNFERLIRMAANDLGIPELVHILTFKGDKPEPEAIPSSTQQNRPAVTQRTNIRQDRSSDSPASLDLEPFGQMDRKTG